ncbi:MAG: hypothetical protein KAJ04_01760, partial [Candidatus Eisenbacteria sp.]|nr:hypothetical protein [Candidatus Eisenbacteria bacterium]
MRQRRVPGTRVALTRTIVMVVALAALLHGAGHLTAAAAERRQEVRPNAQAYLHYSLGRLME